MIKRTFNVHNSTSGMPCSARTMAVGILIVLIMGPLRAVETAPMTRSEFLRIQREERLKQITPPEQGRLERAMVYIQEERLLQKSLSMEPVWGFQPKFGLGNDYDRQLVLESGSGLAFGLFWSGQRILDVMKLEFGGSLSTRLYRLAGIRATIPDMLEIEDFYSIAYLLYRNYTRIDFYGIGSHSCQGDHSNYLGEQTEFSYTIGKKWNNFLDTHLRAGYISSWVDSGRNDDLPSIEDVFDEESAPGLTEQPRYVYIRPGLRMDTRDHPGYTRAGTVIDFDATVYKDYKLNRFSFNAYEIEFQKFIPFLHKSRVIAIRAKTYLSDVDENSGQRVPFYMMPYLGGHNTLRGYREFRFVDRNFLLLNAEYRWAAWTGLDMALFADFGNVFEKARDIRLDDLRVSYGLGFRFDTGQSVFLRLDIAWHESGVPRFWFKMNKVF